MEIDKAKILELLRQRGLDDRAIWVDKQLPDRVNTYDNAGLLRMLNIDPAELADAVS
jgi:hypothetical protein